ncbi:hypothetical protein [Streptomyces sp. AK02-04a]|nr:hypothetical protein [Streptomyces sp. AK02-04a]MDX3763530.1 hypothetical protein [Streptomyces sp. AK02-04a]
MPTAAAGLLGIGGALCLRRPRRVSRTTKERTAAIELYDEVRTVTPV